jgi:hypothetical protein
MLPWLHLGVSTQRSLPVGAQFYEAVLQHSQSEQHCCSNLQQHREPGAAAAAVQAASAELQPASRMCNKLRSTVCYSDIAAASAAAPCSLLQ